MMKFKSAESLSGVFSGMILNMSQNLNFDMQNLPEALPVVKSTIFGSPLNL